MRGSKLPSTGSGALPALHNAEGRQSVPYFVSERPWIIDDSDLVGEWPGAFGTGYIR